MNAANLMGGESGKRGLSPIILESQTYVEGLLDYARTTVDTGEELMFVMDVPYVPVQETPIVLAQAATLGAGSSSQQPDYILKTCQETESTGDPRSAVRGVDPAYMLKNYIQNRDKHYVDLAAIRTTLLEGPKHGKLTSEIDNVGRTSYGYDAKPEYVGTDRAVFMAEFGGKRYKIIVKLEVLYVIDQNASQCSEPQLIKVNKPAPGSSGFDWGSFAVSVAALDGGVLAQTTGTSITLDTHAAGYNWFIDPTPFDNAEFLPTANPNEWIAKAGSEAAGKMDMLSVLLHEYGHALGIGHSAHAGDYMATTLQPGVRRLPSAAELELMAQLAGEIKNDLADAGSNTPLSPQSPLPSLPLGGAFGVALLGRLRGTRYSGWTHSIDSVTQYAIAANPKLSNPDFN